MTSTNPLVIQLSKPELLSDSEKQLKLLGCVKVQLNNNLLDLSEIISPLVKLVASNNANVKVNSQSKCSLTTYKLCFCFSLLCVT